MASDQPGAGASAEQPAAAASAEQPGAGASAEQPAAAASAEQPGAGASAEQPAAAASAEQPAAAASAEQPGAAASAEQPAAAASAEQPAAAASADVDQKEFGKQELQKLLLQRAQKALDDGNLKQFDALAEKILGTQPSVREDRMDRWRIGATGIMLAALVYIIVEIVLKDETSGNLFQFVSLTSGLAGIGLGWLFGAGTARRG
jgi:hypothetical protein